MKMTLTDIYLGKSVSKTQRQKRRKEMRKDRGGGVQTRGAAGNDARGERGGEGRGGRGGLKYMGGRLGRNITQAEKKIRPSVHKRKDIMAEGGYPHLA